MDKQQQPITSQKASHDVVYLPPASDRIERYARQVCHRLGQDFAHPDVVREFTQFVKIAVAFKARRLNEGEKVDNERG